MTAYDLNDRHFRFNRQRYRHEGAMALFTLMEQTPKISRVELAQRIGKSKSFVTKLLSGYHNFTFDTFADLCAVLGRSPHISLSPSFAVRMPIDETASQSGSLPFPAKWTSDDFRVGALPPVQSASASEPAKAEAA